MKRTVIMVLVVFFIVILAVAAGRAKSQGQTTGANAGVHPIAGQGTAGAPAAANSPAPAFSGTTLAGAPVSLASYRGKPLILIFWASW
jgi:cytochrome oxidase Cu insertion factor (SCO1/SenC/PrrC family)